MTIAVIVELYAQDRLLFLRTNINTLQQSSSVKSKVVVMVMRMMKWSLITTSIVLNKARLLLFCGNTMATKNQIASAV